ncbi:hypothetical protein AB0H03_06530 [Streptomyces sparsogenes]|uniref:hypothetical protein n=1 Tax=Streptomyces sparsogenes TaxID=67365 RepID=UPI0034083CD8
MSRRDRDSFSDGGYWTRPDHTGRARTRRQALDRATYDHQPRRGALTRLADKIRGRR